MPEVDPSLKSFARTPAPDLWPDIRTREPRQRPPSQRGGLVATVALVAVISAAAILLPVGLADRGHEVASPPPIGSPSSDSPSVPPFSPHISASIRVGPRGQVTSVAFGGGSAWVAMYSASEQQSDVIRRVDPASNSIVATIEVPGVPSWETGGGGMTFADGSLWVVGSSAEDATRGRVDAVLTRIDAATNRVTSVIHLGGSMGADVAVVDGTPTAWAAVFGDASGPAEIVRIDTNANAVVGRFPLTAEYVRRIAATQSGVIVEEYVWPGPQVLIERLDPVTGGVGRASVASSADGAVVRWNDQVWCSTSEGMVRIDPGTGETIGDPVQPADAWGWIVAPAQDGIWFQSQETLERLDPRSGHVQRVFEHLGANALAVGNNVVWALGYDGRLMKLELH